MLARAQAPAAVQKTSEHIKEIFSAYDLVGPLSPETLDKGHLLSRAVIRIPHKEWPKEELIEKLHSLPPAIEITIDPDEIV